MTSRRGWHAIAASGLLAVLIFALGIAAGLWLAELLGAPRWIGWLIGALVGFLCSRALLRAVVSRQLT